MPKQSLEHLALTEIPQYTKIRLSLNSGIDYMFDPHGLVPVDNLENTMSCVGRLSIRAAHSLGERRGFGPEIALSSDLAVNTDFSCEPVESGEPLTPQERNILYYLQHGERRKIERITAYVRSDHESARAVAAHKNEIMAVAAAGVLVGSLIVRQVTKRR